MSSEPLVTVLTPVHNGAESLTACLKSVQAQDYHNWVHIVVDNASTDDTLQIAESFAARDTRVTAISFSQLLPMYENFNRALAAVPSAAQYLKQLHADDILDPGCLRTMVAAAESDPEVALVVSRFYATVLSPKNAPARATRLPGHTVARGTLLGTSNLLGTPSIPLLRVERTVGLPALFPVDRFPQRHPDMPLHYQGDKESLLATLEQGDVMFVPEPLVSIGDEGRATSFARRVGGWRPTRIDLLLRRGARFLDERELREGVRRNAWRWIRSLAWRSLKQQGKIDPEFRLYQSLCLDDLVPRLRDAGHAREAALLARFQSHLASSGGTQTAGRSTAA